MERLTERIFNPEIKGRHYRPIGCPTECSRNCYDCFVIANIIDSVGNLEDSMEDFENELSRFEE